MKEERQYSDQECNYSIKIGMVGGFLVGWAIGVALLLYVNSPALNQWGWCTTHWLKWKSGFHSAKAAWKACYQQDNQVL